MLRKYKRPEPLVALYLLADAAPGAIGTFCTQRHTCQHGLFIVITDMATLPAPQLLRSVFAKVKHFGLIADSPAGVGYALEGLTVAVGFFGDQVYFFYQSAVLVLSHDTQLRFEQNNNPDNPLLLEKVSQIELKYSH